MEVTPVVFVTHNKGKVASANKYFEGIVRELNYDITDNNYVASRKEDKDVEVLL